MLKRVAVLSAVAVLVAGLPAAGAVAAAGAAPAAGGPPDPVHAGRLRRRAVRHGRGRQRRARREPGVHRRGQRRPRRQHRRARRRHPLGQAVLHRGLRPVDLPRCGPRYADPLVYTPGRQRVDRLPQGGRGRRHLQRRPRARSTTSSTRPPASRSTTPPAIRWRTSTWSARSSSPARAGRSAAARCRSLSQAQCLDRGAPDRRAVRRERACGRSTGVALRDRQRARRLEQRRRPLVRRADGVPPPATEATAAHRAPTCAGSTCRLRAGPGATARPAS